MTARVARVPLALALLFAAAALPLAGAALASVEEFSTFSIGPQEQDDESLLDHFLTRMPRTWRDEWSRSPGGFRTSQGCLTSGQWFIDTDLKARAAMGERAWFGVDLFQSESDILSVQNLNLSFHFPQRVGSAFAMFRPSAEKAAQDFALGWEIGADTSAFQMRATWTLEDVFNNFWAFRQTQVGGLSEPYERRPYEPALFLAVRRPAWRAEAGGKWLTPSRKHIVDLATAQPLMNRELWGAAAHAAAERRFGAVTFEARTEHRQARGHDRPIATGSLERIHYRRQWSAEGAARTRLHEERTQVEARYLYQSRREIDGPSVGAALLHVDDRLINLDVAHEFGPALSARVGGLFERVGVARTNRTDFSFGTRNESRAYVGLELKFGRVRVAGIEGIELDREGYDVWLVHDKGFLQLQTTF
ncbi:MAG: hypothetical protein ABIS67_14755 [Candidatus Eisenbacteria bacterium]